MTGAASVRTVVIVVAALVIRTAIAKLRKPGSAHKQWAFATNPRAICIGAGAALVLGIIGWPSTGYAAVAWAVLAGALVASIVDHRPRGQ
ncbi:hypothetical protein [Streptomyces sp. NPDC005407]|uniref:hypothetical protein n=1 Tax=Streptomyces sp. NPDC005407 TaxID=3155340 RepID=UPI0033AC247E